jgi:hypothetical protein
VNALVPIALYGWPLAALALFAVLPPRRAVIVSFVAGWLLLPEAAITTVGLPDLTKVFVTSCGAMLGVVVFDAGRLARLRPSWIDLPVAVWCLVPIVSSVTNGLGLYDGASFALSKVFLWGLPYLIGRLYFDNLPALRELAIGIMVGGLLYAPLCLIEVRLSPQLHRWVYGFHPSPFLMTMRYGGYRPTVFMTHGLMLGLWMTSASLVGIWLWSSGSLRRLRQVPMSLLVPVLVVVTVLCKSTGAIALLIGGTGLLLACRVTRLNVLVYTVVATVPLYMFVRAEGLWHGEEALALARMLDEDRADSFAFRLENEDILLEKALRKPLYGWGGWGRWRVQDEWGKDISISDGMWIIALGETGMVGLASLTAMLLLPIVLLVRRVPVRHWAHPAVAPAAALAVILLLHAMDNLVNAMPNPVYYLCAGALSGFAAAVPRMRAAVGRSPVPAALGPSRQLESPIPRTCSGPWTSASSS